MNKQTSRNAAHFAALLGTASFFAIVTTQAHAAAAPAAAPVAVPPVAEEEILITGSLIRGAPAIGVPVTAVGEEEFLETGSVTVSEMLQSLPTVSGNYSVNTVEVSGANRQRFQNSEIHGEAFAGQATTTLLLVNGRRHPAQGTNLENTDASLIPSLAIQRIDVLAAGASAVYGSDAVAGVINVILRRNYDGAITQARMTMSTDLGWDSVRWNAGQLFGRTWDNLAGFGAGGLTVSYEWWDQRDVMGNKDNLGREYLTNDFEPFGFDDRTPLASSFPGIVTWGTAANNSSPAITGLPYPIPGTVAGGTPVNSQRGDRYCGNCLMIPVGTGWDFGTKDPGPTVTWATLAANKLVPGGPNNLRSPYEFSNMNPAGQANFATLAFDQEISEDLFGLGPVAFFADGYYMNRRYETKYPPGYSPSTRSHTTGVGVIIPTNNPYRPSGAPANIRAHYSLGAEMQPYATEGSISRSYSFGFNFNELPYEWRGNAFFHTAEEYSWSFMRNLVNENMFNAALGNTIASQAASGTVPAHFAFSKPASIPYLNLFCDAIAYTCNSRQTLDYVKAFRDDDSTYNIRQFGLNLDGPIYDLPFLGGPILGALGVEHLTHHFAYQSYRNETAFHTELLSDSRQFNKQASTAVFGQLNIPLVGERNALPFVQGLMLELGYRIDDYYYDNINVKTPKIAGNWDVGYGLRFRGAYGETFNTAPFGLITNYVGYRERHAMVNAGGIFGGGELILNCPAHTAVGIPSGTVQAGSLQAYLNPNRIGCPDPDGSGPLTAGPPDPGSTNTFNSIVQPVGINLGPSLFAIRGEPLEPETSQQWSLGLNFAPTATDPIVGVLSGLVVDATWWHVQRENTIGSLNVGQGANDPNSFDTASTTLANGDPFTSRYIAIPRPDLLITAPENASFKAIVDELLASGKAEIVPEAVPFIKFIDITSDTNLKGWQEFAGIDFDVRYDWDMGALGSAGVGASGYYETRNRSQTGPGEPIESDYTQKRRDDGLIDGANSGHQMQRMRFSTRWSDSEARWNVNLFGTWIPHTIAGGNNGVPPACFWHDDFGPGSAWATVPTAARPTPYVGCYPGAPFWPNPKNKPTPAGHIPVANQEWAGILQPSQFFVDFAVSYDTGDSLTNPYLQNLRLTVNVNNVLNRLPSAVDYDARTASGSQRIRQGNPFQRTLAITLTKSW